MRHGFTRGGSPARTLRVVIPRFLWAALYFIVLTVLGVVGYIVIQGSTIHDALYMTVITSTAVGYSEVIPLRVTGRNFRLWDTTLDGVVVEAVRALLDPSDHAEYDDHDEGELEQRQHDA